MRDGRISVRSRSCYLPHPAEEAATARLMYTPLTIICRAKLVQSHPLSGTVGCARVRVVQVS